jgi:hypothetical protein
VVIFMNDSLTAVVASLKPRERLTFSTCDVTRSVDVIYRCGSLEVTRHVAEQQILDCVSDILAEEVRDLVMRARESELAEA